MATVAYATAAELQTWLGTTPNPAEAARLLERASELIDSHGLEPFGLVTATQLPSDTVTKEALRDACCAQVEYWMLVGEDHDKEGLGGSQVSLGGASLGRLPPTLAPRTKRILRRAGLLNPGVLAL